MIPDQSQQSKQVDEEVKVDNLGANPRERVFDCTDEDDVDPKGRVFDATDGPNAEKVLIKDHV